MTYSNWRVELSEKYKAFKGLYKIMKTPGVIKATPKHKLKNTVGISYKNSMGTLDYRRSIFPDYKANRRNRFARIKATPSGDPMADISQNIYKKEGKRSLERRLSAKEKIRQEWLKANNLPPDSNAQPPGFNEEALAAPTNNASSGAIAGLPPDDPPVKKRKNKTYAYGGIGSRKMWMKNKYT